MFSFLIHSSFNAITAAALAAPMPQNSNVVSLQPPPTRVISKFLRTNSASSTTTDLANFDKEICTSLPLTVFSVVNNLCSKAESPFSFVFEVELEHCAAVGLIVFILLTCFVIFNIYFRNFVLLIIVLTYRKNTPLNLPSIILTFTVIKDMGAHNSTDLAMQDLLLTAFTTLLVWHASNLSRPSGLPYDKETLACPLCDKFTLVKDWHLSAMIAVKRMKQL